MKKLELKNLREKPILELKKILKGYKEKLSNLKFDLTLGKVKNVAEIRKLKKSIAQISTIISLKEKENKNN